ncbi:hypothetical protein [Arthrobacter sp. HY1533]|uniref:hypothetical protein n=1 Tax=Arthrobacter sp. HY1533 TaxID=2970919 RepID=UPI0022BA0289|nr:hypothetical protein [Arthrobacter sp. HY1533]
MSDRMTEAHAAGGYGIATYGRKTRPEMIAKYRAHYEFQLRKATEALAKTDDEIVVSTYVGPWARTNEKVVTE